MGERPGVMFYFDIRPCLKRMTPEEKGLLFEAILEYGEHRNLPTFDGALGVAWDFIQPRIDKDGARYTGQSLQKRYAVYVRESKRSGQAPMTFIDWSQGADDAADRRLISSDIERYPTTTTTSTTTSTGESGPPLASPPSPTKKKYGQYGWVKLTDQEHSRLLNDLGEPELKRCVAYIDESAQATGNKNKWRDWNLVLRKCSRDGWGRNGAPPPAKPRTGRMEVIDGQEVCVYGDD